jgi:hypothetical protein
MNAARSGGKDTIMTTYEKIQTHQIAGTAGSYGIERQLWQTPRGVREQYAVTVPRPTHSNQCAAERTVHDSEASARGVWGYRLLEPQPGVLWTAGTLSLTWECPALEDRLAMADDLARWAGEAAERVHDEDVAAMPEGRHYTHCCSFARAFAMELPIEALRRRWEGELEERAVERAKRDGVL